jgi:hypothetical protein
MACLLRGQKIKSVFRFPFLAGLSHGWHWQAGTADSPSYMPANLKKTKKNGRGRGRADTGAGRGRPALISCGRKVPDRDATTFSVFFLAVSGQLVLQLPSGPGVHDNFLSHLYQPGAVSISLTPGGFVGKVSRSPPPHHLKFSARGRRGQADRSPSLCRRRPPPSAQAGDGSSQQGPAGSR